MAIDSATNSAMDFSIYAQPKVDCHCHVLDPAGFAYAPLRAPRRLDYGPLLQLFAKTVPDEAMRQAILWRTPLRLFGFGPG